MDEFLVSKEILREMCLDLTGGYDQEMVKSTRWIETEKHTCTGAFCNCNIKALIMVVIIDCAIAYKVLFDPAQEEIKEIKEFSLVTW